MNAGFHSKPSLSNQDEDNHKHHPVPDTEMRTGISMCGSQIIFSPRAHRAIYQTPVAVTAASAQPARFLTNASETIQTQKTPNSSDSKTWGISLASSLLESETFGFFEDGDSNTLALGCVSINGNRGEEGRNERSPGMESAVSMNIGQLSSSSGCRTTKASKLLPAKPTNLSCVQQNLDFELSKISTRELADSQSHKHTGKKHLCHCALAHVDCTHKNGIEEQLSEYEKWKEKKAKRSSIDPKNEQGSAQDTEEMITISCRDLKKLLQHHVPVYDQSKMSYASYQQTMPPPFSETLSSDSSKRSTETETNKMEQEEAVQLLLGCSNQSRHGTQTADSCRERAVVDQQMRAERWECNMKIDSLDNNQSSKNSQTCPLRKQPESYILPHGNIPERIIPLSPFPSTSPNELTVARTLIASASDGPPPDLFARWSASEDELLLHAVQTEGGPPINWKLISTKYFKRRRNENQCKGRWKKVGLVNNVPFGPYNEDISLTVSYFICQHVRPEVKRTAWSKEEDELLLYHQSHGLTWPEIAEKLPGRISDQVRDRFKNFIDPTLNRTPFSEEERKILFEAQLRFGNRWTAIARLLPGRSENMVKNCWHNAKMSQRRKLRRLSLPKKKQSEKKKKTVKNTQEKKTKPKRATQEAQKENEIGKAEDKDIFQEVFDPSAPTVAFADDASAAIPEEL